MMPSICSAGLSAADYATDSTYSGGWSAGQNGGYGFGAWSFNTTDPTPAGTYQGMNASPQIGTAWTLATYSASTGLANAGRAINGGLGVGQTFETVIQNPSTSAGFYTYRGWDILFTSGPDNNGPGNNTSALRLSVFDYYNASQFWTINDAVNVNPALTTPLTGPTTALQGVKIDLTLTSATGYFLTMTPLSGATSYTHAGTLTGPISYVDFRSYNGVSGGLTDTANNLGISYMTIVPEPSSLALIVLGMSGFWCLRRRK
jgi:hypothetical protein